MIELSRLRGSERYVLPADNVLFIVCHLKPPSSWHKKGQPADWQAGSYLLSDRVYMTTPALVPHGKRVHSK